MSTTKLTLGMALALAAAAAIAAPGAGYGPGGGYGAGTGPCATSGGCPGGGPGSGPGAGAGRGRMGMGGAGGYGGLMTEEERADHRATMHGFTTLAQCTAYWTEHRAEMAARAKERGLDPGTGPRVSPCDRMAARGLLQP